MKQLYTIRRTLSAIILLLASAIPCMAEVFDADGIHYGTNQDGVSVSVMHYVYSGDIVIPSTVTYNGKTYSVTNIEDYAFQGCKSITSISIPESVTKIGECAFMSCSSISSISIPKSVTIIEFGAFSGCTSLTSISIPENITNIRKFTFYNCTSLTSISIPKSVTSIGQSAFLKCSSLTSIVCHANEVPELHYGVFSDVPQSQATLYVPSSSIEAYRAAGQWGDFGKILPLEEYGTGVASPTAVGADTGYDVYTIRGTMIRKGCNLNGLPAGAYILRSGNESKTVVIR